MVLPPSKDKHHLHDAVHAKAVSLLKVFMAIGGMPEIVSEYIKTESISRCQVLLDSLVNSFRADFKKYRKKSRSNSH